MNARIGRATEHFLNIMGKSGTIEDKEDLPEDYSIELDFPFRMLKEMIDSSDSLQELEDKLENKQVEIQERYDNYCEELTEKIENRIEDGTEVIVESAISDKEGIVRGYTLDRGKMFYKVYDGNGSLHGNYLDEVVEPKSSVDAIDKEVD